MKNLRKTGKKLFIIVLILFALKQLIPVLKLDGYSGMIWSAVLFTDDTKYTKGYTGNKFLRIKKGMSKNQVYQILGKPFAEFNPTDRILSLQYSESPKDTHYRIRQVYLHNNTVVDCVAYFYVDELVLR